MLHVALRSPEDSDWPDLLALANRSVAGVAGATDQKLWVANRRAFDKQLGTQLHWVACDVQTGDIVGYVCVESRPQDRGARLFVVTEPEVREDLGARLLSHAMSAARDAGAADVWFIEYAADTAFLEFLGSHGFTEALRFLLPDRTEACVMTARV